MLSSYLLLAITLLVGIFQIEKLFPESFKAKPWIIFGLLIVLTIVSFVNEHERNKAEDEAKIAAKIDADRRDYLTDSTANARVDSSTKVILTGLGNAIGKYSLGYDSAKDEIVRLQKLIKDSANRKTTIVRGDLPTVDFTINSGIRFQSIKGDSLNFSVHISSYTATSILKDIVLYVVASDTFQSYGEVKNLRYIHKVFFNVHNYRLIPEKSIYRIFGFADKNLNKIKTIYILLTGEYTDSYGNNLQKIDEVGFLNLNTKKFEILGTPYDDQIRAFIKSTGELK